MLHCAALSNNASSDLPHQSWLLKANLSPHDAIVASVTELPAETDMLDLFRRSDAVAPIVDEALAALPGLKTVWMQLGVENAEARAHAEAMGVTVIENRCPKIEYPRLFGDAALVELVG